MGKAHKWAELKELTEADLIKEHDQHAKTAPDYMATIRDELRHREQTRQTAAMVVLSKRIAYMTLIITAATIANVILWALK